MSSFVFAGFIDGEIHTAERNKSIGRAKMGDITNFAEKTEFGSGPLPILYVPDAEGLEIYSKIFGTDINFEIGIP